MLHELIHCSISILGITISEVRLVDGSGPYEGRVEVRVDTGNDWGTLCDDNWGHDQANAICRHLGYLHAEAYTPRKSINKQFLNVKTKHWFGWNSRLY